jgi:hypothetical protein
LSHLCDEIDRENLEQGQHIYNILITQWNGKGVP